MNKVSLLSETDGFQSFVQAIRYWEINSDQNAHQTSIKIL